MLAQRSFLILATLILAVLVTDATAATKKIDFNKDGNADLAVASPGATINGDARAGSVTVIYGIAAGVNPTSEIWHQDLASVPGSATTYDSFGYALATGDFNRDGYTDLAIGDPDFSQTGVGTVFIFHGSPSGLVGSSTWCTNPCPQQPIVLTMTSPQVADHFGSELVAADFDANGFDDLAVGAPDYDHSGKVSAGAVQVFYGRYGSLTPNDSAVFTLATLGIFGGPESNDKFGHELTAGNLGKTRSADLAIGMNKHSLGGAVTIIYGGTSGLYAYEYNEAGFQGKGGGNQMFSQTTLGFSFDQNDFFGRALAAGDFGNGPYDDLAIGAPGANALGVANAGAVYVLTGSEWGLAGPYQQWTLDSFNVTLGLRAAENDMFGTTLTAGNIGYDGSADLAIGVPFRLVNGKTYAGAVAILFGTAASGLKTYPNAKFLDMGSHIATSTFFGNSLMIGDLGGDTYLDLALGAPYANAGSVIDAGALYIRYGSSVGPSVSTSDLQIFPGSTQTEANFGYALPNGGDRN